MIYTSSSCTVFYIYIFYSQKHLCWLIHAEYLKCMQIFPCLLLQHFMTDIIFLPVPTLCILLITWILFFNRPFKNNVSISLCHCQKPYLTKSQTKMSRWQVYTNFLYLSLRAILVSTKILIHCFLNLHSLFKAQCDYDVDCNLTHKSRLMKNCHSSINFAGFLALWPWRPYHKSPLFCNRFYHSNSHI